MIKSLLIVLLSSISLSSFSQVTLISERNTVETYNTFFYLETYQIKTATSTYYADVEWYLKPDYQDEQDEEHTVSLAYKVLLYENINIKLALLIFNGKDRVKGDSLVSEDNAAREVLQKLYLHDYTKFKSMIEYYKEQRRNQKLY